MKKKGHQIIVVEQTTESKALNLFLPVPGIKCCFVFGNEVDGVTEEVIEMADVALEIPQAGTKHSLNISVCLGIVVWEVVQKLKNGIT